jgi:hypothetical protein
VKESHYLTGQLESAAGRIPVVSGTWSARDRLDAIRARWKVGRMSYKIPPGIYAAGSPDRESKVFISSNYKLSFDHLRTALSGIDAWILVLDTFGINVWCAAGKGTFGTAEIIRRINLHHLAALVDHRTLVVPQLGAPGVAAHEVLAQTGFRVVYGPVRASDIPAFLAAGMRAGESMRTITFTLKERARLIPVEITYGSYYLILVPVLFLVLAGLQRGGYSLDRAFTDGGWAALNLSVSYLAGCALTPLALPWIPFRRFSLKGLAMGWLAALILFLAGTFGYNLLEVISWVLITGAISSYMAMNFTGSSTFTSLSGVQKEMKTALPMQISFAAAGLTGWIISRFTGV